MRNTRQWFLKLSLTVRFRRTLLRTKEEEPFFKSQKKKQLLEHQRRAVLKHTGSETHRLRHRESFLLGTAPQEGFFWNTPFLQEKKRWCSSCFSKNPKNRSGVRFSKKKPKRRTALLLVSEEQEEHQNGSSQEEEEQKNTTKEEPLLLFLLFLWVLFLGFLGFFEWVSKCCFALKRRTALFFLCLLMVLVLNNTSFKKSGSETHRLKKGSSALKRTVKEEVNNRASPLKSRTAEQHLLFGQEKKQKTANM